MLCIFFFTIYCIHNKVLMEVVCLQNMPSSSFVLVGQKCEVTDAIFRYLQIFRSCYDF